MPQNYSKTLYKQSANNKNMETLLDIIKKY